MNSSNQANHKSLRVLTSHEIAAIGGGNGCHQGTPIDKDPLPTGKPPIKIPGVPGSGTGTCTDPIRSRG